MNVRGHCSTHNGPDTESAPAFSATPDCAANEPPARPAAVTFIEADDPTAADRSLRDQVESAQREEAYTAQSCVRRANGTCLVWWLAQRYALTRTPLGLPSGPNSASTRLPLAPPRAPVAYRLGWNATMAMKKKRRICGARERECP